MPKKKPAKAKLKIQGNTGEDGRPNTPPTGNMAKAATKKKPKKKK